MSRIRAWVAGLWWRLRLLFTSESRMAVTASSYAPASYTATGGTVFATGWKFFADTDLTVTVDGVTKTLGTDYTVIGAGSDAGGDVTFTVAPTSGVAVVISRSTPKTQPTSFRTQGSFSPSVHEAALDRATLIAQEIATVVAPPQTGGTVTPQASVAVGGGGTTDIRRSASGTVTAKLDLSISGSLAANAFVGTINETWARPVSGPWSGCARLVHGGVSSLVPVAIANTDGSILVYASLVAGDSLAFDAVYAGP